MYIWGLLLSWEKRNNEKLHTQKSKTQFILEKIFKLLLDTYVCMLYVCVYVCLYVCIYMCIYVCVYLIAYERTKFCTWIILRIWIFAHFIFYHCAWFSLVKLYSLSEQSIKNYILIQCSLKACCVFLKEEEILLS